MDQNAQQPGQKRQAQDLTVILDTWSMNLGSVVFVVSLAAVLALTASTSILKLKRFTTDEIARIQSGAGRKGELGRAGMARVGCAGVAM